MDSYRERVCEYLKEKYKADPEQLWISYPDQAVFRHADNGKWFGIIMDAARGRPGQDGADSADVLSVRLQDALLVDFLARQPGYFRGCRIPRGNWISIMLDGTVPFEEICGWLDESYLATASREKKQELRPPKEWLVPANPKYYDIEHAFDREKEIFWKQGTGIRKDDTVYMYVAAPVSAILYQCRVTETGIPCDDSGELRIRELMKIRLLRRYPADRYTFEVLGSKYGIFAVRGPRGVPAGLSEALKR